jgi:hypothetical protein
MGKHTLASVWQADGGFVMACRCGWRTESAGILTTLEDLDQHIDRPELGSSFLATTPLAST